MRITERLSRRAALLLGCGFTLSLLCAQGCKSTTEGTAAQQAEFRKAMGHKGFDINDVPEKDRARVRALMQANGATGPSAGSSAPSAPASAGK